MKLITDIARYFVGVLFIFSGIVKANDPLGFSYKLEEYFEEFAKLGEYWGFLEPFFHFCHDYALPQAIFLVVLEVVLGVAILVRFKTRLTATLLLLLIMFFTALTFASAYFGIVKTCGCFGDAIPLTAWESFYKDVILSVLILIIFIRQKQISISETGVNDFVLAGVGSLIMLKLSYDLEWFFPFWFLVSTFTFFFLVRLVEHRKAPMFTTILATFAMAFFTFYTYSYLPAKDFRAYAPGKSIAEQMEGIPDKLKYFYILRDKETGKEQEFEKFPENYQEKYEYVDSRTEVIEQGVEPKIMDFSITSAEGEDLTEDFLMSENFTFLLISYDLNLAVTQPQPRINELAARLQEKGYRFVGLTSSSPQNAVAFAQENSNPFSYLFCDQIVLKTIIRSNPGLLLLKDGKVYGKWHYNDLPELQVLELDYLNQP
ncbi:MAG: DoxX family membrane protein [Flavobacteriales bacterium]|nr:DoxX family membrane protein [Flavobacteriales bacterium]